MSYPFLTRATATVKLRRDDDFKVKPSVEPFDGQRIHVIQSGTCDGGIYDGEPRWDVDFNTHRMHEWHPKCPTWFAQGDLTNFEIREQ